MMYTEMLRAQINRRQIAEAERLMAEITYYGDDTDPEIIADLMNDLEKMGGNVELLKVFGIERFEEWMTT